MDMNVVKTDTGDLVEVQASAEKRPFSPSEFDSLMQLADKGIQDLVQIQKNVLKKKSLLFMAYGN
jgi:ribonuclease PH